MRRRPSSKREIKDTKLLKADMKIDESPEFDLTAPWNVHHNES